MRPAPAASRRFLAVTAPLLAVLLLTACGGGGDEATEEPVAAAEADPAAEDSDDAGDAGGDDAGDEGAAMDETEDVVAEESDGSDEATRVCDALTAADPDTAFADLTFDTPQPGTNVAACRMALTNAEGEGLSAALDQNDLFSVYQEQYAEDEDVYREIAGLGEEAFILNDAQLHVRQGDERWMISLQAFVFGDDPAMPEPSATEAGLTEIARTLLDR